MEMSEDLQARYDNLLTLVMRMSEWLASPQAELLSREAWEEQFQRHLGRLDELRRLGDELRPVALQERTGAALSEKEMQEIADLFAA
jgi:hypothetical protein